MAKDLHRYQRQILLPEIGTCGQERLSRARVLVAGAGGLGSASALYLAAAGIGCIRVADDDGVEISNLNRQVLHSQASLGKAKVASAASRLSGLNPDIHIEPVHTRINAETIDSLVENMDIIVDGSDNYNTRTVLNRAAIRHGKPYVFGGVTGFDGMVSVFRPGTTPCFECIIPKPEHPDGAVTGIIGPTAGMAGNIQAMETIKLILGVGTPLENRLLRISGKDMRIKTLSLSPNPDCPACSHLYQESGVKDHPRKR